MREVARLAPVAHAVDLGAGVGTIGLQLLALGRAERVTLVENDPASAALLRENASPFGDRAAVVVGDVADVTPRADVAVLNPPYFDPAHGRGSPEARRRSARRGEVLPFLSAAARCAPRAVVVYPSGSLAELVAAATNVGLDLVSARLVHSSPSSPARLVIASFGRAEVVRMEPPWFERGDDGSPDPELQAFLRDGLSDRADDRG